MMNEPDDTERIDVNEIKRLLALHGDTYEAGEDDSATNLDGVLDG